MFWGPILGKPSTLSTVGPPAFISNAGPQGEGSDLFLGVDQLRNDGESVHQLEDASSLGGGCRPFRVVGPGAGKN